MQSIYACLFVPDFPAAALQRQERRMPRSPLAVFTGKAPNCVVHAASAAARAAGIQEGMPLAEAKARFAAQASIAQAGGVAGRPWLRVQEREEAAERQAWRETLDMALTVSPRVEDVQPGLLIADFAGLRDPHAAARQLANGAERLGLPGNVAVSLNRFVAECAARTQSGITHVFPGQEGAFLHVLPVEYLPLEDHARQTLSRWGVETLGAFAALPEKAVVDRLGPAAARWLRMAHGQDEPVFQPHEPEEEFTEQMDFEWQVADLESLAFVLADLLKKLCDRLDRKNLAVGKFLLGLKLAGGSWYERELLLPTAHTDTKTFVTLARLDLSAHPPGEPVEGMRVVLQAAPRRVAQFSLFEPVQPSPEKLDLTLARLNNLVGEGRAGSPVTPDSHREEVCVVKPYAPPASAVGRSRRRSAGRPEAPAVSQETSPRMQPPFALRMALRCLRPAPEAAVRIEQAVPVHVAARGLCDGPVGCYAGPWRMGGEWWTEEEWDFEEWDVAVGAHLLRIRCELPRIQWKIAGIYD
jgi:protein ImuB